MVQYSQENMCWTLFNKITGLETCNFIKNWLQHRCFLVNIANFYEQLFLWTLPMAAFMSTQKGRRGKRGTKKRYENISFNFYQQVLVLVNTEIQIQLCKYWNCSPFFSYFFFKFSLFWFLRVHFLCFHFWHSEKCLLLHLLVYSKAGIRSCSVKQLVQQDITEIVNFLQNVFSTVY